MALLDAIINPPQFDMNRALGAYQSGLQLKDYQEQKRRQQQMISRLSQLPIDASQLGPLGPAIAASLQGGDVQGAASLGTLAGAIKPQALNNDFLETIQAENQADSKIKALEEKKRGLSDRTPNFKEMTGLYDAEIAKTTQQRDWIRGQITKKNEAAADRPNIYAYAAGAADLPTADPTRLTPAQNQAILNKVQAPIIGQVAGPGGEIMNVPVLRSGVGALAGTIRTPLKPLPKDAQESLQLASQSYKAFDLIDKNIGRSGLAKGTFSYVKGQLGFDRGAADFQTAQSNLSIGLQALVPGVPSNKDLSRIEATFPNIHLPKNVNQSRLKFSKEIMGDLVEATIANYKGQGFVIPGSYMELAKKFGKDPSKIKPWDRATSPGDAIADKVDAFLAKERAESSGALIRDGYRFPSQKALDNYLKAKGGK